MLVIAHRGARSEAPENSMDAFEKAIVLGADGIELDVRTSSDGVAMVMHDPSLNRTTGVKAKVSQTTYARLLQAKLSNGTAIPTLDDVLHAFANRTIIYLELKDRKSAPETERLAAEYPRAKITVSSFDVRALAGIKLLPKALLWDKRGSPLDIAMKSGCAEIHPRLRRATARMIRAAHALEMNVVVWDVHNPTDVRRAMLIGADCIIADDPSMVKGVIPR